MKPLAFCTSIAGAVLVSACVVMPTAPFVPAMPGSTKTLEQFSADDAACRGSAYAAVSGPANAAATTTAGNTAAATVLGAAAGALIGAATGDAGAGAAIGAGTGLVFGAAANSSYAGASSYDLQRAYDATYLDCMYARGHKVPAGFAEYRGQRVRGAPNHPPRDYPPPASVMPGTPPATLPQPTTPPPRG
jgi:hypothetical protein